MNTSNRILFVHQEINPFIEAETPVRLLNRALPEICQANGFETRTFMPKFGEVNERKFQLHDVIRLSGLNLSIDDVDYPLLIKVSSIQAARIQIYFIDNDDLFHFRRGVRDAFGVEYSDNDVRTIFFARGVMETVQKLRWAPRLIYCSGWMPALIPVYVKRAFAASPFFANTKVIFALDSNEFGAQFSSRFSEKMMLLGMVGNDVRSLAGMPVGYEELMHLAIDYSDIILQNSTGVNPRLLNYAHNRGKEVVQLGTDNSQLYIEFLQGLANGSADSDTAKKL